MRVTPAGAGGGAGPGLPIVEVVRFVTVARRMCREAFETLGRRSVAATTLADRAGVAAASRQLGETLPLFDALLPDAVGLKALANDTGSAFEADGAFASWCAWLGSGPIATVAVAALHALQEEVEAAIGACSPVADAEFVVVARMIEVRLCAARDALAASSVFPTNGPVSADDFPRSALRDGRKIFSSPLEAPI